MIVGIGERLLDCVVDKGESKGKIDMEETRRVKEEEEVAAEGIQIQAQDEDFEDLLIRAFLASTSFAARRNEARRCSDEFRV